MTADSTNLTGGTASVSTTTPGETPTTTATFDGVPIDVNVAFPAAAAGDGPFPLLIWGHGYGGSKIGFGSMKQYTDRGYAVFSMTDRGFHESCGTPGAKARDGGTICEDEGYVRLMDTRYEVRDAQQFAGLLNNEGVVDGQKVGALGGSYGGGLSMALARAQGPHDAAGRHTRPLDQPGPGQRADADRRRGPEHPVDRPQLRPGAERQHARLRAGRRLHRTLRRDEAVARQRALPLGADERRGLLRAGRAPTPRPT